MLLTRYKAGSLALIATLFVIPSARAQWAVVDVGAIAQLFQQVQTLRQELQTAQETLQQARDTYASLHGNRGMAQLLSGVTRNYLPPDWPQVAALVSGAPGAYGSLAGDVQSALTANAVLSPAQLAARSAADQQQIQAMRQLGAIRQALSRRALADSSARFASMQALIATISSATDSKAALDLQARISAELAMLQNEQTKLNAFDQVTHAQEAVYRDQQRELTIAADGNFSSRLQPTP